MTGGKSARIFFPTILLDKPPVEESVRFVVERFASAGKTIARETSERLVAKIENIPYYIQQLGFETFRLVDDARRKSASPADVDAAYAHLSGFNRDRRDNFSSGVRFYLRWVRGFGILTALNPLEGKMKQ